MTNIVLKGTATPLGPSDLTALSEAFGVEPACVWTVLSVETKGMGFLADGRPKILLERHYVSRLTHGRFDGLAPDVCSMQRGGYIGGSREYARFLKVVGLAGLDVAVRSCSWGLGQVMGDNCEEAGSPSFEAFWEANKQSERGQLGLMLSFVRGANLLDYLKARRWDRFARGYNGSAYAENRYDEKLAAAYDRARRLDLGPVMRVRRLQAILRYAGASIDVDGATGPATDHAVTVFLQRAGSTVPSTAASRLDAAEPLLEAFLADFGLPR